MIRVIALSLALSAANAAAQVQPPQRPLASMPALSCADFRRNSDGSWSPTHTLLFGNVAMSPGTRFQAGMKIFGSDLGATLTARCLARS